jgi:thermostable 8-oxoguanine DNA glycosylase
MHKLQSGDFLMQTMHVSAHSGFRTIDMPDADCEALPGIPWGRFDHLLTAAYWKGQVDQASELGLDQRLRLGSNLIEETAACLLGGYGMKGELGVLAFKRLRERGLLDQSTGAAKLEASLAEPFLVDGASIRYRFPRQKSRYLERLLQMLECFDEPEDDVALRDNLTALPGVGLKTASWVVRNHRASNSVAVLDVHIIRACEHLGIFPSHSNPQKEYRYLEARFLHFARAIEVPASLLDAVMWRHMRLLHSCIPASGA